MCKNARFGVFSLSLSLSLSLRSSLALSLSSLCVGVDAVRDTLTVKNLVGNRARERWQMASDQTRCPAISNRDSQIRRFENPPCVPLTGVYCCTSTSFVHRYILLRTDESMLARPGAVSMSLTVCATYCSGLSTSPSSRSPSPSPSKASPSWVGAGAGAAAAAAAAAVAACICIRSGQHVIDLPSLPVAKPPTQRQIIHNPHPHAQSLLQYQPLACRLLSCPALSCPVLCYGYYY